MSRWRELRPTKFTVSRLTTSNRELAPFFLSDKAGIGMLLLEDCCGEKDASFCMQGTFHMVHMHKHMRREPQLPYVIKLTCISSSKHNESRDYEYYDKILNKELIFQLFAFKYLKLHPSMFFFFTNLHMYIVFSNLLYSPHP